MKSFFYLLLTTLLLTSCTYKEYPRADGTYFRGEIINPVRNYITLSKDIAIIDTVYLDRRNRFFYEFKDFEEGLYQFNHGEVQIFHIEPGDSIIARVNTKEYDESLAFSGYGSERSNYLVDLFLHWEEENKSFQANYQKSPKAFKKVIDSLQIDRRAKLDRLLSKNVYSEDFQEIARAAAFYDNYQRLETYPIRHNVKDKISFINSLPKDFYSYRQNIDLNSHLLNDLFSYQRYINSFIDHQTFLKYGENKPYDRLSYVHSIHKIDIIDSLISEPHERDRLLRRVSREFIASNNNSDEVVTVFKKLRAVRSSPDTKYIIEALETNHKSMEAGNKIPDVLLTDKMGVESTLMSHITKPTILYFWSHYNSSRARNSHKKAAELKQKYPEFVFIGININEDQKKWAKSVQVDRYDLNLNYRFSSPYIDRKKLVINDLNKTIVVDANGVILNSHANLHHANFENDLLAYLNQ